MLPLNRNCLSLFVTTITASDVHACRTESVCFDVRKSQREFDVHACVNNRKRAPDIDQVPWLLKAQIKQRWEPPKRTPSLDSSPKPPKRCLSPIGFLVEQRPTTSGYPAPSSPAPAPAPQSGQHLQPQPQAQQVQATPPQPPARATSPQPSRAQPSCNVKIPCAFKPSPSPRTPVRPQHLQPQPQAQRVQATPPQPPARPTAQPSPAQPSKKTQPSPAQPSPPPGQQTQTRIQKKSFRSKRFGQNVIGTQFLCPAQPSPSPASRDQPPTSQSPAPAQPSLFIPARLRSQPASPPPPPPKHYPRKKTAQNSVKTFRSKRYWHPNP